MSALKSQYLQRINRNLFRSTANTIILYYDSSSKDLRVWFWPVNEIQNEDSDEKRIVRVTPSDLVVHRVTHNFHAPSCLCVLDSGSQVDYIESAIYLAGPNHGEDKGQYVMGCATESCGYFGECFTSELWNIVTVGLTFVCLLVPIEHLYSRRGLLLKKYQLRGKRSLNIWYFIQYL